ncbi:MAG TPA: hypothetical protein VGZ02_04645 [Candidatus Baltobacteraceae bacterium]|nr:hypothetical protein [Candidatus Baltobacteraceae bacterium]
MRKLVPSWDVRDAQILAAVFALAAIIRLAAGPLLFTGDEPRYAFQGLGLYSNHAYYPTLQLWRTFLHAKPHAPVTYFGVLKRPYNTLAPCILYGPLLVWFGLNAARWLSYVIACAGIAVLYVTLRRIFTAHGRWPAAVTIGAIALFIPLLPYMQLIYPEALLFLLVSLAFWALLARRPGWTCLFAVLLPFAHPRVFPLACTFAIVAAIDARRELPVRKTALLAAGYVLGFSGFVASQFALFGSFTGGAFSMYSPSLAILPMRLGMQLFDVRHGLLAYSPILAGGFAGLVAGAIRRNRACAYASVLLAVYAGTFIWATADESWTARYWISALPLLAVGLCFWVDACERWQRALVLVPLAAIGVANTWLFTHDSESFLDSRRTSVPYAELYAVTHIHFGLYLPIDADPFTLPPYTATIPALLALSALAIFLLAAYVLVKRPVRNGLAVALVTLFVAPYAVCAGASPPDGTYSVTVPRGQTQIDIRLLRPGMNVRAIQFDRSLRQYWSRPTFPSYFAVRCYAPDGTPSETVQPSRAVIAFPVCGYPNRIQVRSFDPGDGAKSYRNVGHLTLIDRVL